MRTIPSADPPCISVRLRKPRYAESADNDLRRSGGHTGPEYLLDIVCAIEPVCGAHVAVAFRAVGSDDDQIEVVLKVRSGWVRPDEGYLERRRPQAGRTRPEFAAACRLLSARRLAGDVDGELVGLSLVERAARAEARIGVRARKDHRAQQIDPPEPGADIERRAGLARAILSGQLDRSVDEQRFDERGWRRFHPILDERLAQHRGAAGDERSRHTRSAIEEVVGIARRAEVV